MKRTMLGVSLLVLTCVNWTAAQPAFDEEMRAGMPAGVAAVPRKAPRAGRRGAGPKRLLKALLRLEDKLELSAEQKQKIEQLDLATQEKGIRLRADMQIAALNMKHAMRSDPADFKEARKRAAEQTRIFGSLKELHIDAVEQVDKILSAEQKAKLRKTLKGRWKRGAKPRR